MQRELVERAQAGDHDAFSGLVRASLARLYAIATLILRDGDRAQDAVQEALVSPGGTCARSATPTRGMPGSIG